MGGVQRAIGRFRRPEYTGENRCPPCTVVNVALAAGASAALAAGVDAASGLPAAVIAGVASFALFAAVIYLRGYLVPGTPTITKRYFPDRILRAFDKRDARGMVFDEVTAEAPGWLVEAAAGPVGTDGGRGSEAASILFDAGALREGEDGPEVAAPFRSEWRDAVEGIREDGALEREFCRVWGVDPGALTLGDREYRSSFNARIGGEWAGQWRSREALIADLAAARTLRDRYDGWNGLDDGTKGEVLYGLRPFLDACPGCGGSVSAERRTDESCCREPIEVVALDCGNCGARLFKADA